MKFKVTVTQEVFTDDAGNTLPYVAYTMRIDDEDFKLVPKKNDKRLLSYLFNRYNILKEGIYFTEVELTQEHFRDVVKRKTIDYVAYTINFNDRNFCFQVRPEDRNLVKFLLEEKGFCISDDLNVEGEDDD